MEHPTLAKKNYSLLLSLLCVVAGMLMLSYAAVPLYSLFCRVTGYGGTPSITADSPNIILSRRINVSFNTDISPDLHWDFKALDNNMDVAIGERKLAFFEATNLSDHPVTATSIYNVTPFKVGGYFAKLQCFCFEEQTLAAGETMEFPVSFYIDPELASDENLDDITNITLSYTFFPVKK